MPSHLERLLSAVVALQRHLRHDTARAWSADESGCVACLSYDELQDAAMEIARAIDALRSRVAELEVENARLLDRLGAYASALLQIECLPELTDDVNGPIARAMAGAALGSKP